MEEFGKPERGSQGCQWRGRNAARKFEQSIYISFPRCRSRYVADPEGQENLHEIEFIVVLVFNLEYVMFLWDGADPEFAEGNAVTFWFRFAMSFIPLLIS
jgi:hypothetical protein